MTRRLGSPAALLFLVACTAMVGGLAWSRHYGDVDLYSLFAHRIRAGEVPYRDFFVEYPPGSLVAFIVPGLISLTHYTLVFKLTMALCGAAAVLLAARIGTARPAMLAAIALAPLALGPVVVDEFDLWPTVVTVGALLAFLSGRHRLGAGLLGFAAATKIFPLAILPAALVWIYRRSGRREARAALAVFVAVVALTYVGFVAVAPGGVWYSTHVQLTRGLQKESFGAAILFTLDKLGLYKAHIVEGHGSWTELTGPAGDALAVISSLLQVAVALAAAALLARRRPDSSSLVAAAAAAVTGFVAFGKIFSPQYLVWLIPLVPLAAGLLEVALLGASLVLTQLWFLDVITPFDLGSQVWLFVTRDLLVLALAAALLLRLRARRTAERVPGSARAAPT